MNYPLWSPHSLTPAPKGGGIKIFGCFGQVMTRPKHPKMIPPFPGGLLRSEQGGGGKSYRVSTSVHRWKEVKIHKTIRLGYL